MHAREIEIEAVDARSGGGAPSTPAYVALPDAKPRYGIVVIHEMFGRKPDIDRACDRIARAGCAAIAPDLSARGLVPCLFDMHRALRTGEGTAVRQTLAARAWLAREAGLADDRIALLGFCVGGGFALASARGWAAVSTNYGEVPELDVLESLGPVRVIGCFGARDRVFGPKKAALLEARLTKAGLPHEIHVVPDAGHSFLTDGAHPVARVLMPAMAFAENEAAREAGWTKIFAFFDACFGESPSG
jgi:carboxymethylenebutenolidase